MLDRFLQPKAGISGLGALPEDAWECSGVITERAILDVRPGQECDFESAFAEAKALIASMPGFESLQLH